jgi:hypothetical protein
MLFFDSQVAAEESGSEQMTVQNGDRKAFFLFLVNFWSQVRGQCFSTKAV